MATLTPFKKPMSKSQRNYRCGRVLTCYLGHRQTQLSSDRAMVRAFNSWNAFPFSIPSERLQSLGWSNFIPSRIEWICIFVTGTRSHGMHIMNRDNVSWRSWEVTCLLGVHRALALFPSKRQWTCCGQAKVTPHWRERMRRVSWKRQREETEASRHWFLTSLTRRPFNIAPHAVVNPNPKVTPVLEFHNSNLVLLWIVM